MNNIKIFFTLVLFFSFGIAAQAQVGTTSPSQDETTIVMDLDIEMEIGQEVNLEAESNITKGTTNKAVSSITEEEVITFYFNHKQFLRPVVRKHALA